MLSPEKAMGAGRSLESAGWGIKYFKDASYLFRDIASHSYLTGTRARTSGEGVTISPPGCLSPVKKKKTCRYLGYVVGFLPVPVTFILIVAQPQMTQTLDKASSLPKFLGCVQFVPRKGDEDRKRP